MMRCDQDFARSPRAVRLTSTESPPEPRAVTVASEPAYSGHEACGESIGSANHVVSCVTKRCLGITLLRCIAVESQRITWNTCNVINH